MQEKKMMVSCCFFEVCDFQAQFQRTKLPNSNSVDNFASLDTPGEPGGVKVVELSAFEKYTYQLFCDSGAALADFFTFMKMLPNVSFILVWSLKKCFCQYQQPQFQLFYRNSLFEGIIMKHLNQKSVSVFWDFMIY